MNSQLTRVGFTIDAGAAVPRGDFKKTVSGTPRLVRIERVREIAGGKHLVQAAVYHPTHPARVAQLAEETFL